MRSLWMFPFTFVAGVHGFAMFAPYLLMILGITFALRRREVGKRIAVQTIPSAASLAVGSR